MPTKNGLYYRESQDGEEGERALVWLHGAGGSSDHWPYQFRRMAGWRVLTPDLPGHGRSGGKAKRTVEAYAKELAAWQDAVGVGQAVIGGHSLGAAIALQMALDRPDRVQALILMGAGARMPVNPDLLRQLAVPADLEKAVTQISRWSLRRETSPAQRATLAQQLRDNQAGVLSGDFQACGAFDVVDRLTEIGQTALVISGEQDVMMPAYLGGELAAGLVRGTYATVNAAGHMLMQENTQAAADHVKDFLNSLRADQDQGAWL